MLCSDCNLFLKSPILNKLDSNKICKCKNPTKGLMGDYKVPILPIDSVEREKQFKLKKCFREQTYYLRCLPAQVQLAEKMRKLRGQRVEPNSRIEYIICNYGDKNAKQYEN